MSQVADPLEGITEKSTKADMLQRLNDIADRLRGHEKARVTRIGEIERRVAAKHKPYERPMQQYVVVGATRNEWHEMLVFLEDYEETARQLAAKAGEDTSASFLPAALAKIVEGAKVLEEAKLHAAGPQQ